MSELKPCPFCGGHEYHKAYPDRYHLPEICEYHTVACTNCGATCGAFPNKEEAIEAWNRRNNEDNV